MALTLVTAPTADPLSLADIKAQLRIEIANTTEDATLRSYAEAARGYVEGRNRALLTQTWDWWLDCFDQRQLDCVPLPPLQSVTSVKYLDAAGVLQTVAATDYLVDTKSVAGRITPAYGLTWPYPRTQPNAVQIRIVCGYGAGPGSIPNMLRLGLLGLVTHFYEHREVDTPVPNWVNTLLDFDRVERP